jgi:hypothetical protein
MTNLIFNALKVPRILKEDEIELPNKGWTLNLVHKRCQEFKNLKEVQIELPN